MQGRTGACARDRFKRFHFERFLTPPSTVDVLGSDNKTLYRIQIDLSWTGLNGIHRVGRGVEGAWFRLLNFCAAD